ncbi:hypothetical protein TNCT_600091 [Trichonephila clavata]|uniref:Uncharacterized protein n=1 Tax=Trichonephila clavata TaxID=2740835 RepID=A0A8X6GY12_TRICU|nr:hypothetical protein TNCT_600091 [Trichonephila clavata]
MPTVDDDDPLNDDKKLVAVGMRMLKAWYENDIYILKGNSFSVESKTNTFVKKYWKWWVKWEVVRGDFCFQLLRQDRNAMDDLKEVCRYVGDREEVKEELWVRF